jgi:multiple sugar transport system ATP-binding protein
MAKVVLSNLTKEYDELVAVDDVSLEVKDGDFVTLVGPSGCGKTTILRMIAGLTKPTAGKIFIGEKEVTRLDPQHRKIAMVFQDYALFPHMSVWKNVAFGLHIQKYHKSKIRDIVDESLAMVGLTGLEDRSPAALSGGQRQRVALARALALDPNVFLMDEPLSNLDAKLRLQVRTELKRIHKKVATTTIYVTHDQVEAMSLSNSVVILKEGKIQQVGSPEEVYHHPTNKFVAGFIGSPPMNFFESVLDSKQDQLFLQKNNFTIELPPAFSERISADTVGNKVVVGVRPEHIYSQKALASNESNEVPERAEFTKPITMTVDVVEPMGSNKYLDLFLDDVRILARVGGDTRVFPDEEIQLVIDSRKIHLFDTSSEEKLTIG